MSKIITYECQVCHRVSRIDENDAIPVCCQQLMQKIKSLDINEEKHNNHDTDNKL